MPRRTRCALAAAPLALTALLAACGSSSSTTITTSPTSAAATTTAGSAGGSSTTAEPTSTGSSSTAGPTSTVADYQAPVSGPVPAVTGATDLTKEPTIAAGTGTPPTQVTAADLVTGTGTTAAATDTVTVQYVGTLYQSGQVFDASWKDGQPATFPLNGVVPGFKDAIVGMKIGGRREVVIPPAYGYGAEGNGPVPANATLVFVIDLLKIS